MPAWIALEFVGPLLSYKFRTSSLLGKENIVISSGLPLTPKYRQLSFNPNYIFFFPRLPFSFGLPKSRGVLQGSSSTLFSKIFSKIHSLWCFEEKKNTALSSQIKRKVRLAVVGWWTALSQLFLEGHHCSFSSR